MPYFVYTESSLVLNVDKIKQLIEQSWRVSKFSVYNPNSYIWSMDWDIDIEGVTLSCNLQSDLKTIVLDSYPREVVSFALWLAKVIYPPEILLEITHDSSENALYLTTDLTYQDFFTQLSNL